MGRSLPASIPCQICGDKSYGRHYGLWTCDGCSCFFKRSVRRSITYTCISGDNKCPVDKTRRNWCPACRLRKCFDMQMNKNAVQKERGPRKRRSSIESTKTSQSPPILTEKDLCLMNAIRKASESSVVMFLTEDQKLEVLERFWAMFLVVYAAEHGNTVDFSNKKLSDLISFPNPETTVQKLDSEEARLLSCMLFCKIGQQIESLKFATSLYDTYCFWLVRHCTVYYPLDPSRAFILCGFLQKILCHDDFSSMNADFSISPITIIRQLMGK